MRGDEELLAAWRAGDRDAGGELVDRHFAAISRFFRNKVTSEDDATELVSQTFLACTASKERFRGAASVLNIPCITTISGANALVRALEAYRAGHIEVHALQDLQREALGRAGVPA